MNLAIHTGAQSLLALHSEDFQARWRALYDACPWATAFQHPDFVLPWYEHYQDRFLPVIVLAESCNPALTGLLTMAFHSDKKILVGAGECQAEYHAWLAPPDAGCMFIQAAVDMLRCHFPGSDLHLKYLPPGAPLDWIEQAGNPRGLFCLRMHRRPVMKIDEAGMDRQRRKKNHRQNFNRLKKSGDVAFEKLDDHERFAGIFEKICVQYDFRQGALHHYMPFASDRAKKPFYLELHKRGLLHTSILTVGEEVAASHSGVVSKGSMLHLGINSHAPALAAHSPGNLLLAMLGVHLAEEKIAALDLTPGGDGYKENFATEHDTVHELTVYGGVFRRWKNEVLLQAKQGLKNRMRKAGWRTADAWAALGKFKKIRQLGMRGLLNGFRQKKKSPYRIFQYSPQFLLAPASRLAVSKNSLQDILLFDPAGSLTARWEFLKTAMERMERSMDLYTHADGGRLLVSCWVRKDIDGPNQAMAGKNVPSSDKALVLSDLQVHHGPDKNGLLARFITQVLLELKDSACGHSIYLIDLPPDSEVLEVVMQCGFVDESDREAGRFHGPSSLNRDMQDFSTGG